MEIQKPQNTKNPKETETKKEREVEMTENNLISFYFMKEEKLKNITQIQNSQREEKENEEKIKDES